MVVKPAVFLAQPVPEPVVPVNLSWRDSGDVSIRPHRVRGALVAGGNVAAIKAKRVDIADSLGIEAVQRVTGNERRVQGVAMKADGLRIETVWIGVVGLGT